MYVRKRGDFDRLQGEIQELIDDLWQVPRFSGLRSGFRPPVDCMRAEDGSELRVVVELPGVDPADVNVIADDRTLVIAGERQRPPVQGRYQQMEIEYGPFQRKILLSEEVDPSRATAEYERGFLTIVLPIAERKPPVGRVEISVGRRT
jgi:HSP20 family protein